MELNKSKVSYRNEAMHNYMVIETSDIESTNFREKMITENDITGILSTKITKINSDTVFMYDISSMQSLAVLYEKKTYSASDIDNILESLYRTVKNMAPYFLDVNNLIVDKDLIFMNMENGNISFSYNPYFSKPINKQLEELSRYLMDKVDYSNKEATYKVFMLNQKVLGEGFVIDNLASLFEEKSAKEENKNIFYEEVAQEDYLNDDVTHINIKDDYKEKKTLSGFLTDIKNKFTYKKVKEQAVVCETKTVYKAIGEQNYVSNNEEDMYMGQTVLLSETKTNVISFKPDKPYFDEFELEQNSIVIGKMEEKVDVVIKDPSVSRIHAKCEREGDRFFIEDLNTTNRTYLDNKRMVPYKMEEIFDGSRIRFGQVGYCVVIR